MKSPVELPHIQSLAHFSWQEWIARGGAGRSPIVVESPKVEPSVPRLRNKPCVLIPVSTSTLLCLFHCKRTALSLIAEQDLDVDRIMSRWRLYSRGYVLSRRVNGRIVVRDWAASRYAVQELRTSYYEWVA